MKNVQILDCTLRDGGRIIDCKFSDNEIRQISYKLANAKINIVEIGFLRDHRNVEYKGNSTFFTDVDQIRPFVDKSRQDVMYTAFIDYGMFDFDSLKPYDGTSIDAIRFGFTKKNYDEHYDEVLKCAKIIKDKGYKLFMQGVNSLSYTDLEILELIEVINKIKPYSFGIVDTYGAMYIEDVDRIYGLINNNMDSDICINFHSHNNYQLSFGLAQEVIKLSRGSRNIIIDATLGGMGKVAGNLNTELIVDYMVRKLHYDYEFENVLDIIDEHIYKYAKKYSWGYSVPAMMAGIYKSHPNNVIYLTEKFRLSTKDISNLLAMIDPKKRQRYDYDNIERLYVEYIADKTDDYAAVEEFKARIGEKEVLVLAPGNTMDTHSKEIESYIEKNKPFVISVNFVYTDEDSYAFFGNRKRYDILSTRMRSNQTLISSNIKGRDTDIKFNYHSLINRGYKYFENSTIMLLNLLKRVGVKKLTIAGFDGFSKEKKMNYLDNSYENDRHFEEFEELNSEIGKMFGEICDVMRGKCEISFVTPSLFEKMVKK